MASRKTNPDFLNGVPELLVLQLLAEESMHGYLLVQRIKQRTDSRFQFGEGCIYPVLHRLEADGKLLSKEVEVRGRKRLIYCLTKTGQKQLESTVSSWKEIVKPFTTFCKEANMNKKQWLHNIETNLQSANLPRDYINRILREFADHHEDALNDKPEEVIKELGVPEELVSSVVLGYRHQHWAGRHPVLAYFILPPVVILFLQIAFIALSIISLEFLLGPLSELKQSGVGFRYSHPFIATSIIAICSIARFVPLVLVACWIVRNYKFAGRKMRWGACAIASLSLFALLTMINLQLPTDLQQGQVIIRMGEWNYFSMVQISQAIVPLAIGCLYLLKSKHLKKTLVPE